MGKMHFVLHKSDLTSEVGVFKRTDVLEGEQIISEFWKLQKVNVFPQDKDNVAALALRPITSLYSLRPIKFISWMKWFFVG